MNNKIHKALIFSSICSSLSIYGTNTAGAYMQAVSDIATAIAKAAEETAKREKTASTPESQNSDCIKQCDSNQSVQSAIDKFSAAMAKQGSLTTGKTPDELQRDLQDLIRSTAAVGEAYQTCTNACAGTPGSVGMPTKEAEKNNIE